MKKNKTRKELNEPDMNAIAMKQADAALKEYKSVAKKWDGQYKNSAELLVNSLFFLAQACIVSILKMTKGNKEVLEQIDAAMFEVISTEYKKYDIEIERIKKNERIERKRN